MQRPANLVLAAAAVALFSAGALAAAALEVPIRKPGLWEITVIGAGSGTNTAKICIGANDKILSPEGGNCGEAKASSGGEDTIIVDVICTSGDSKETISGAFTGDFTTRYQALVKMTFDPPPQGMPPHMGVTIDGKYLGPDCPDTEAPAGGQ